ncbi:MAG: UbiA family prenyltransferase [Cyclobacteriaceae bacterium]
MQQIKHILYSIRPSAGFMAAVLAFAAFRPSLSDHNEILLLCLYFFAGSSFCFLVNDLFDREKDMANKKNRPIATGELPVLTTSIALFFFGISFIIAGCLLNEVMFWLAVLAIASFSIYSPINNKTGLLANIIVAFWAVAPVWEGFFVLQGARDLIWLSLGLFVMVIAREILLDWLDIEGDKSVGKSSLPIVLSEKHLKLFLSILMVLASILIAGVYWFVQISEIACGLLILSVILSWVPFIQLLKTPDKKTVLYNVRFSHVSFGVFTVALFLR